MIWAKITPMTIVPKGPMSVVKIYEAGSALQTTALSGEQMINRCGRREKPFEFKSNKDMCLKRWGRQMRRR